MFRTAVFLLLLSLLAPVAAQPGPVDVVEGFLQALHERRYADAWSFLDSGSQAYIIDEVCRTYKMDEGQVKTLFDSNHPQTKPFWEAFRKNANTDGYYSKCSYTLIGREGESATIGCRYPGNDKVLELLAVHRNGRWGFDYFTTFVSE